MKIVNGYLAAMDPADLTGTPGTLGARTSRRRAGGPPVRPGNLRAARSARARGGVQHDPEAIESGHTAHEESELHDLHRLEGLHPRMRRKAGKRRGAGIATHDADHDGEDEADALEAHEPDHHEDWRQRLVIRAGDHTGGERNDEDGEERRHDQRHEARHEAPTHARDDEGQAPRQANAAAARGPMRRPVAGFHRDADIEWVQAVLLAQIAAIQQPDASVGRIERQTRDTMLRYLAERARRGHAAEATDTKVPARLDAVRALLVAERERLRRQGIEPRPAVLLDEAQQRQYLLLPLKVLMLSSPGLRRHGNQAMASIQSLLGLGRRTRGRTS